MVDKENNTIPSGGGGGGGGNVGGKTTDKGKSGICTAGGPGTSYCSADKCGVVQQNPDTRGSFMIKFRKYLIKYLIILKELLDVPYRELPPRDRKNTERPSEDRRFKLKGHTLKVSSSILIIILISTLLYMESTG